MNRRISGIKPLFAKLIRGGTAPRGSSRRPPAGAVFLTAVIALAGLLLTGCEQKQYSDAEVKAQKQEAQAVAEAWLAEADPGARITSLKEMNVRTSVTNHNYYLTDFVTGSCSSNGSTYDFAVNTATGELYTSREFDAFRDALCSYLLTKLALPASDYAVRMHTARPLPVSGSHPEYGEYPFENMLPAQIPDMNAYAREAVSGEDMNIYLELAYSGGPMNPEGSGITAPAGPGASGGLPSPGGKSVLSIYRLADGTVEDSEIDGFNMSFAPVFAAEALRLEKGQTSYARYAFEDSAEPFVLHFPERIVRITEPGFDAASETAGERREASFDGGPGGTFFLEQPEPQRLSVQIIDGEETGKFYSHLILTDLAAADGIREVLMKERSVREWYISYYEWEPVCGVYVLSAYRSPEHLQDGDIVVYGETGKALLEKQTKENEERMKNEK